jgi:hypothetical protein
LRAQRCVAKRWKYFLKWGVSGFEALGRKKRLNNKHKRQHSDKMKIVICTTSYENHTFFHEFAD